MNLLKRYESDDFDESYDYDDAAYLEEEGSSRPFLVKAIAMIIAVTGIAYGANIALTSNSDGKSEFGQGILRTTACDPDGITITPIAGYVNETGTGKFTLDTIYIEGISSACVGNDFTIQVFGDTSTALTISESATSLNNYNTYNLVSFYFSDSVTATTIGSQYTDTEVYTDPTSNEFATGNSQIQVTFDPDRTISFADATAIRNITIQTAKH